MRTILDTGPLVSLLNARDKHHQWTLDALSRLAPPLWTCEPVVTEAAHLTGRGKEILEMIAERQLRIGLDVEEQSLAIAALMKRYGPRMDFADACVVRMSELTKRCQVFTLDRRDFGYYRRNGREAIPLLAPSLSF
jgi:predicted nucleic acid-binding protein